MTDIVVHHLDHSRSTRVLWLLEELELPYRIQPHARNPDTLRAPEGLRAVHPLGKAPVVTIDGAVLAESGAILETIDEELAEGRLRPAPGTEAMRRYRFFMHYAEGSLMPPLLVRLIFDRLRSAPVPFFVKPLVGSIVSKVDAAFTDPEIATHTAFLEAELGKSPWLTGDTLTVADIQLSYPLEMLASRTGASTPNLTGYLDRVHARPAYRRALEKGGPVTGLQG